MVPSAIDALFGSKAILTNEAGPTVKDVWATSPPALALICAAPGETAVTLPVFPTLATELSLDFQSAVEVKSWELPSVNVPVATNCWVTPAGMVTLDGVIVKRTSAAGVMVKLALPEIEPEDALMRVAPTALP